MKNCLNCEHKKVCREMGMVDSSEWGEHSCENWYGWVSVNDELPEEGEYVECLIYGSDVIIAKDGETLMDAIERISHIAHTRMGCLETDECGQYWYSEGFPMIVQPSYWKRLPEAPKGEGL